MDTTIILFHICQFEIFIKLRNVVLRFLTLSTFSPFKFMKIFNSSILNFLILEFNNRVRYFRSGVLTCKWYIWKKLQVLDEINTNQQISLTLKVYQICLTFESSNMCFYVMTLTLGF